MRGHEGTRRDGRPRHTPQQQAVLEPLEPRTLLSATYFLATSMPSGNPVSDSHDGRDNVGLDLSGATWTASSRTLHAPGAFAGYSPAPGDYIYISSATAGQGGLYTGVTKSDSSTLTFTSVVSGGVSSDESDVTTSNGAVATFLSALTKAAGGTASILCGAGAYNSTEYYYIGSSFNNSDISVAPVRPGEAVTLSTTKGQHGNNYFAYMPASGTLALSFSDVNLSCEGILGFYAGTSPDISLSFTNVNYTSGGYGVLFMQSQRTPPTGNITITGGTWNCANYSYSA